MKRIAIITGASSGFGKEFALQLDMKFRCIDEYWLIARSEDKLQELSDELLHKTKIIPLDLCKEESIDTIVSNVRKEHAVIKLLINSAGFCKLVHVRNMETDHISDMIKLNCTALTLLTKKLIERGNINIHADLIAGLPGESLEKFRKSFNDVYPLQSHQLQLGFLKILHGKMMEEISKKFQERRTNQ